MQKKLAVAHDLYWNILQICVYLMKIMLYTTRKMYIVRWRISQAQNNHLVYLPSRTEPIHALRLLLSIDASFSHQRWLSDVAHRGWLIVTRWTSLHRALEFTTWWMMISIFYRLLRRRRVTTHSRLPNNRARLIWSDGNARLQFYRIGLKKNR